MHKGTEITITGKVERRVNGDNWVPFAGAPVISSTVGPDWQHYTVPHQLAATTTGPDGTFSYTITANMTTTMCRPIRSTTSAW